MYVEAVTFIIRPESRTEVESPLGKSLRNACFVIHCSPQSLYFSLVHFNSSSSGPSLAFYTSSTLKLAQDTVDSGLGNTLVYE